MAIRETPRAGVLEVPSDSQKMSVESAGRTVDSHVNGSEWCGQAIEIGVRTVITQEYMAKKASDGDDGQNREGECSLLTSHRSIWRQAGGAGSAPMSG